MAERAVYVLTLEALPDPDGAPAVARLRGLLKSLLRAYRMKALDVREIPPGRAEPLKPGGQHDSSVA